MEACERFSYYGMRAILTIYLIYLLKVQVKRCTQSFKKNSKHATNTINTPTIAKLQNKTIISKYKSPTPQPHYPDNEEQASSVATMIFHVFAFGSYASGLLGAALADSKAGLH